MGEIIFKPTAHLPLLLSAHLRKKILLYLPIQFCKVHWLFARCRKADGVYLPEQSRQLPGKALTMRCIDSRRQTHPAQQAVSTESFAQRLLQMHQQILRHSYRKDV